MIMQPDWITRLDSPEQLNRKKLSGIFRHCHECGSSRMPKAVRCSCYTLALTMTRRRSSSSFVTTRSISTIRERRRPDSSRPSCGNRLNSCDRLGGVRLSAGDHQYQVAALYLLHIGERKPLDHTRHRGSDRSFHLHRLDRRDCATCVNLIALADRDSNHP